MPYSFQVVNGRHRVASGMFIESGQAFSSEQELDKLLPNKFLRLQYNESYPKDTDGVVPGSFYQPATPPDHPAISPNATIPQQTGQRVSQATVPPPAQPSPSDMSSNTPVNPNVAPEPSNTVPDIPQRYAP